MVLSVHIMKYLTSALTHPLYLPFMIEYIFQVNDFSRENGSYTPHSLSLDFFLYSKNIPIQYIFESRRKEKGTIIIIHK